MHAQDTRILRRAYDAAAMLHISTGPTRTSRTCRPAPRSPLPSHHTITRALTHTMRQAPPTTEPRQRHGACHPKTAHTNKPRTAHRTLTHSIQTHKPRTPTRRPAQPQPLRSAQTSLHTHRRTHATHSTAHSSALPTHRPQKITPSHTRGLRATLTLVQSGCSASTGCCRRVG
jgi:hypothetical protein